MDKYAIHVEGVCPPKEAYSHVVRAGAFLFVAGQVARDEHGRTVGKGDAGAQAAQIMQNINLLLRASGTTFESIVKMTVYLVDTADLPAVGAARRSCMREPFPASTTVQVAALAEPDLLVEIEAVALVG